MCVRKFAAEEDKEVKQSNFNHTIDETEKKMKNNLDHDIIFDNKLIPDRIKTKIAKASDKYKRYEVKKKNVNNYSANTDILAQSTRQLKIIIDLTAKYYKICQNSNLFKNLSKTTQPAHIIAIIAVLCAASALIPKSDAKINNGNRSQSKLLSFIYLTSFMLHIGSQFWMTFVSGLSLYFGLPRKNFGQVQRILFPRYFTINACFSLTTLVIFLKYHPFHTWDTEITVQIGAMFSAFFTELFIRLYFTPPLIGLMTAKSAIEKAAGIGDEIGHQNLGPLENCPHYLKMNRAFRKIHKGIAMGNIFTMICTVLHLNYLVGKIYV